jgi:hypothetical protein
MKTTILTACAMFLALATPSQADCVFNAKSKTKFKRIDNHTLMLYGGGGPDILIKTFSFILPHSSITVLKDSFCSYEDTVLLIDGEVVGVRVVTKID